MDRFRCDARMDLEDATLGGTLLRHRCDQSWQPWVEKGSPLVVSAKRSTFLALVSWYSVPDFADSKCQVSEIAPCVWLDRSSSISVE